MPRTARAIEAGMVYHVLNRGNAGMRLFEEPAEYGGFEEILAEGLQRYPVALLTYCLMPNHWHLVVQPKTEEAVGRRLGLGGGNARPAVPCPAPPPAGRASVPGPVQEFPGAG